MRSVGAIALGLFAGFGVVRLLFLVAPDLVHAPALARENFRGKQVATVGGLLVVLSVLAVEGGRVAFGAIGAGHEELDASRPLVLLACVGFGLLGLLDDIFATGEDRGFAGHLRALRQGRVTTGLLKLLGGGALALVLSTAAVPVGRGWLLADAVLIALAANLANLLDRAPGRALKCGLVAWIPLAVVAGGDAFGVALAPVIGAFFAVLPDDLGERVMLGDCGANVLGGVLGLGVVLELGSIARLVVLGALVALNLASEWVSFGAVIERVSVLRRLDRLGRLPPP